MDEEFRGFDRPGIAVDVILFAVIDEQLQVALIQRHDEPYSGKFAMPGRFVRYSEPIEETAKVALKQKCDIDSDRLFLEQLYTFGQNMDRDTRIRTITVVYYAILSADEVLEQKSSKYAWHPVDKLPPMAFDHADIVSYAVERLRNRILWDTYAVKFLPANFTLTELQHVYEIILDQELDKRNFRKKILSEKFLEATGRKKLDGVHRPAMLYRYKPKKGKF